MAEFEYQRMVQEALLSGIVKRCLKQVEKEGLPGDHHFYISFSTTVPGVEISPQLRRDYPTEMVVVLQHRFWNLRVDEDRFEIDLTFNEIPQRLSVPYRAIKAFFDPSVEFGVQFDLLHEKAVDDSLGIAVQEHANLEKKQQNQVENETNRIVSLDAFRSK